MSLILDALRKSAGERQRGQAPTLASAVGLTPRRRAHPARMPVALALLAGTAGAAWWLGFGDAPAPEELADRGEPSAAGAAPAPETDAAMVATLASAPTLADAAPALRPEAVQLPLDDVAPQMGEAQSRRVGGVVAGSGAAALPLPVGTVYTPEAMTAQNDPVSPTPEIAAVPVAPVDTAVPSDQTGTADPKVAFTPPSPAAPEQTPAPAPAPAEDLQTIDQLDYSIRRELPSLDVSMYVYHADPARRFLIIDGKRYPRTEATGNRVSRIDDKVELLEIRSDGAVLEFNGQRFLLPRGR